MLSRHTAESQRHARTHAFLCGLRKGPPWQPSTSHRRRATRTHKREITRRWGRWSSCSFRVRVFSRVGRKAANDVEAARDSVFEFCRRVFELVVSSSWAFSCFSARRYNNARMEKTVKNP